MKLEKWWKCTKPGCKLAYREFRDAANCHHAGLERVTLLVDDKGKPVSAPTRGGVNIDEDETFGLMSDLLG